MSDRERTVDHATSAVDERCENDSPFLTLSWTTILSKSFLIFRARRRLADWQGRGTASGGIRLYEAAYGEWRRGAARARGSLADRRQASPVFALAMKLDQASFSSISAKARGAVIIAS